MATREGLLELLKQRRTRQQNTASSNGTAGDRRAALLELLKKKRGTGVTAATEAADERTWFQKGAFADGYQFGDITKTILGTGTDTAENLGTGILGMGEKFVDTMAYMAPVVEHTQFLQDGGYYNLDLQKRHEEEQKRKKQDVSEFIAKDLYDEEKLAKAIISEPMKQATGIDAEKDSVFGEKTDSLVQSAGQLAGQLGMQAVGVPWWLTTGATTFGSETENAFREGATYEEAGLSGVISAGAEILTEKISGGIKFGKMGTLDDALTKRIASGISNKVGRTFAKLGMDVVGEGAEEVLSGVISKFGQWLTYQDDQELGKLLFSEEAVDEAVESFIGGAVLGGVGGGVQAVKAGSKGADYASGLTKNERAVVDKVYKAAVAEAEKEGKVSQKRKNEIYDQVIEQMDRGEIDTETIEEVLGGKTYKAYQDTVSKEDSKVEELKAQIKELEAAPNTVGNSKKYDALQAQLEDLKSKSSRSQLKDQLGREVSELVKQERLGESYAERGRKAQAFQADVSQYDERQRATVQAAIDSGILNNTRRAHEFVDLVAKISADKGVAFNFADNKKLKETGFALEGVTVNGFVNSNGVTVNVNSAKALNSVVGHEIAHVLEGTELYDGLKTAITEYAKSKGDYKTRLAQLTKLYEGKEGYEGADAAAKIEREVVADLVGDYLFTDKAFVSRLSAENRTVFEKIFDEVKYLCRIATAGSKEARQLEKVKKAFEEAYRAEGTKNPTGDGGVRYSLSKNAKTELHKALYDKNYQGEVLLRDVSPPIMLAQKGVKNLPMSMKASHIRENVFTEDEARNLGLRVDSGINYHGLGENFFLQVIDSLDNVKEAYRGTKNADNASRRENYFLLVSEFVDKDGNTINVPVYIDEHALFNRVFIDVNKVSTVFGKTNFRDYINRQIHLNNLVRIKNRSNQTSESNAPIARDYGKDASMNSIRNPGEVVNNKNSLSPEGQANDDPFPLPWTIKGEDVALQEFPLPEDYQEQARADAGEAAAQTVGQGGGEDEDIVITSVKERLQAKQKALQAELAENQRLLAEYDANMDKKIAELQAKYDGKKNKDTKYAQNLLRRIETLKRRKTSVDADYAKRVHDIEARIQKVTEQIPMDHSRQEKIERDIARIDHALEYDKAELEKEFAGRRKLLEDRNRYISTEAGKLYEELRSLKRGVKASDRLAELLDAGYEWDAIRSALVNIKHTPGERVNIYSEAESHARELLAEMYENAGYDLEDEYSSRLRKLEQEAEAKRKAASVAGQRRAQQGRYEQEAADLAGDTTTWKDKKVGISYQVNTLRRNLRDVVRKGDGSLDIKRADAIYDWLQGSYNRNEAKLNRHSRQIKQAYADMEITEQEDVYIQMLGELRANPETSLTDADVAEYYRQNAQHIDKEKVDKAIEMARKTYDELFAQINAVLRQQGMKEIPYRKGYFPHFTEPKQGKLAKLLNWKVRDDSIPTDIAGLTEQFNPNRSWQRFNKERKTDLTDYSFQKGLDNYVHGALDWIYHIEDIQRRRAFENHIRYVHSDEGVRQRVDAIRANHELDAEEAQEQIDAVWKEKGNPLNNFVTDLRTGTNVLAGKKSSMDRGVEGMLNRKVYSVMSNLSNRVSANMVGGSISSALTNFIPITQSWGQVSPVSSLKALGDAIRSAFQDDGMVDKSDFLTNRLRTEEALYKTGWDKISDKVSAFSNAVDSLTAQTVWRSKYMENIAAGMSENEAIRDADQFAENVIAGRSRGNMPTIFASKNPVIKMLTAFQLEVANQYGYMLKDMPQDMHNEVSGKLVMGYAKMFIGAFVYNSIFSALTGRDAAFDPARIISDLLRDLFDDDEEPVEDLLGFAENVLEEVPFVGGLLGGGRVPISSALPYDGVWEAVEGTATDIAEGDWKSLLEELSNPVTYLLPPVGGGQIRKTAQGISMYANELPGSYTASGGLRFPVQKDPMSVLQAILFGRWSSDNAEQYIDEGRSPLSEKQTQEFRDTGMSIQQYWDYRDGLKALNKRSETGTASLSEKGDYIASLDLTTEQKNILINSIANRETPIDMTDYDLYPNFEEFDYGTQNPGKYAVSQAVGGYTNYIGYKKELNEIKGDNEASRKQKVTNYINSLDAEYGEKIILYVSEYPSKESRQMYGHEIVDYLNGRSDISYSQMVAILLELGFEVSADGRVTWD